MFELTIASFSGREFRAKRKKGGTFKLNTESKCEMNDEGESHSISSGGKGNKYLA